MISNNKPNQDLKGLISALLVPYTAKGEVNEQGLRQIIRHNIDTMRIDGLYVGGSTGENFILDGKTKRQIFHIAKDETQNDVTLIAQIGSNDLYESIELAQYATDLGYNALSAVTPYYYKFSFAEIKQYYFDLMESVENRMIVYAIPFLTGVNIGLEQFGELFAHPKIVGVKFTAADFYLLERLRHAYPDHLIWSGFDEMLLPACLYNVDGAIGSTYNVNAPRARQIIDSIRQGNLAQALEAQKQSNDLISAILDNGLYSTLKQLLVLSGCDSGEFLCRKPMASATPEQIAKSQEIYQRYLQNQTH